MLNNHIMAMSQTIMAQYRQLKTEAPACVLLMQVGVFMQVLDDDARTVSQVTGLNLRMSGAVDDPVVVGGFPLTGLDAYVGRLVRAGHSVAIAAFAAECLAGRAETPPHHRDDSACKKPGFWQKPGF